MRDRPRLSVILCVTALVAACKSDPAKTPNRSAVPAQAAADAAVISFADRTGRTPPFPEKEFQSLARAALQAATPADVSLCSAALQGILTDNGEDVVLSMNVRLDPAEPALSLRTALRAVTAASASSDELVARGLVDLKQAVSDLLHLVHAPPERLTEALAAAEPDIQIAATSVIGARRIREAVGPLCKMLGDPRDEAAEAAADALKKIAEPSDVSRIIASIERKNLRSEVRAVEIIGRLGGAEAEAYLEMTAVGHPIEEVRNLSVSLLKTLREQPARGSEK